MFLLDYVIPGHLSQDVNSRPPDPNNPLEVMSIK